jgi:D-aspartate ligase
MTAIVLCKVATGLATVRALACQGIEVHAFIFSKDDPLCWSRHGQKVMVDDLAHDEDALVMRLRDYAARLKVKPVVIPTCDSLTLALAKHADMLSEVCRISTTPHELMQSLICKDRLYAVADRAGVPVIPFLFSPDLATLDAWSVVNAGPYLLKPSFESARSSTLKAKNRVIPDRAALLAHGVQHGLQATVIQQLKLGGDGEIYDAYGYSDHEGQILSIASHRRWRQQRPDLGSTCFGEIPSGLPAHEQQVIFDLTETLLNAMPYHGIFGIEWLRDQSTGAFHLIDFNARPFLCIGHLRDCGINLPFIAYQNLTGAAQAPRLKDKPLRHKFWLDFRRDLEARRTGQGVRRHGTGAWLGTLMQASSFAYWDWMDPGPWAFTVAQFSLDALRMLWKVLL